MDVSRHGVGREVAQALPELCAHAQVGGRDGERGNFEVGHVEVEARLVDDALGVGEVVSRARRRDETRELGDIGGIPRVLDAGQCNDSYSLALIALKLKEVFGLDDINDLPIVYNISWYEQKAVIVLLALLYLGVKNIHLGPTLPAFLSPNVAKILVDTFGIAGITTVEDDMKLLIGE